MVGFSHASTPFEKLTTVTPISGISRRDATVAGRGLFSTSARVVDVSLQAVTATVSAEPSAARKPASVGGCRPSFCGDVTSTTRPSSDISVRAIAETSSSVIAGSIWRTSRYSYSMPGAGSFFRNRFRSSCANEPLSDLSRSVYTCSYDAASDFFARSSSERVEAELARPRRFERQRRAAVVDLAVLNARAASTNASTVGLIESVPESAPRNFASGFRASSPKRSSSIICTRRSTSDRR